MDYVYGNAATAVASVALISRGFKRTRQQSGNRYVFASRASAGDIYETRKLHEAFANGSVALSGDAAKLKNIRLGASLKDCEKEPGFEKTSIRQLVSSTLGEQYVAVFRKVEFNWNENQLDFHEVYCMPKILKEHVINRIRNKAVSFCNPFTGYEVISYDGGRLTTSCICKVLDIFGGPTCRDQVACGVRTLDD